MFSLPVRGPISRLVPSLALLVLAIAFTGCGRESGEATSDVPGGTDAEPQISTSTELPPPENEADHVLASIISQFQALNQTFEQIQDEEGALEAVPEVERIVDQLHESLVKGQSLDPDEKAQSTERYQARLDAETRRFSHNVARLTQIPGASSPIIAVLEAVPDLGAPPDGGSTSP